MKFDKVLVKKAAEELNLSEHQVLDIMEEIYTDAIWRDFNIDEIIEEYYVDESDDWLYYIDRDEGSPEYNKVSIIKYKGTKSVVTVPTHLEGCEVIRLYSTAFSSNKIVTNVTIPEGIEFLT